MLLFPVVVYVPPPPQNRLNRLAKVCVQTLLAAPVESFSVRAKVEIGVMAFALILIVPTKAAVGVYVSDVPLAFGPQIKVDDAALVDVPDCWAAPAEPIATVIVPPPMVEVMASVPEQDADPVGVPRVPVVGVEVKAVPAVSTAMAAVTAPLVTVIVPVAPDPPPPVTVRGYVPVPVQLRPLP